MAPTVLLGTAKIGKLKGKGNVTRKQVATGKSKVSPVVRVPGGEGCLGEVGGEITWWSHIRTAVCLTEI